MGNWLIIISLLFTFTVFIGPINAQEDLSKELTNIFDEFNTAAKNGDVEKMISLRTTDIQKDIRKNTKKKTDRSNFILMSRAQVPESYETQHVSSIGDNKAKLYILAQYAAMPEIQRERGKFEISITYIKENNQWKMDMFMQLADAEKIIKPQDLTYSPADADSEKDGQIEGRIVKTEFLQGYTLVILRVMDEENAVFLPGKEELLQYGLDLHELDPWNLYFFEGHPHRTDKLKFFANRGHSVGEE